MFHNMFLLAVKGSADNQKSLLSALGRLGFIEPGGSHSLCVTLGQLQGSQRTPFNLCRYFVKAGTPTVLAFVKGSPFSKKYFSGKKVHRL